MFGHPSLNVVRKSFAIEYHGDMVFKLPPDLQQETLELDGVHVFEPMAGRKMGGWIQVPAQHEAKWQGLAAAAMQYVAELNS